jgi:hypothetical protein
MKKALLLSMVLVCCASLAFAQGGSIGLFADPGGANCNIADAAPGLCNVYVVHVLGPAVSASEFGISAPTCLLAGFLSYTPMFAVDIAFNPAMPLEGRSVGYGGCLASPVHISTLGYFCQALTGPCCLQTVIPHLGTGVINAVDCDSNLLAATGGAAIWNSNSTCTCNVAAHESTWGGVKEMFAN